MATLQVMRQDKGSWKAGDVVSVIDDADMPEPPAPGNLTSFVRAPGTTPADFEHLLDSFDVIGKGPDGSPIYTKREARRRYNLNMEGLPTAAKLALDKDRQCALDRAETVAAVTVDRAPQTKESARADSENILR